MKKLFSLFTVSIIAAATLFTLNSCTSCGNDKKGANVEPGVISVENYTLADKAYMTDSIGGNYEWFETDIQLIGNVDTLQQPTFSFVSNVFQKLNGDSTTVYIGKHSGTNSWFDTIVDHWMKDVNMLLCQKKLITFDEAFKKLKQSDCVQPKSAYCVLREPLGPKQCNPQYIFGNDHAGVVFVDAVDGTVSTINPASGTEEYDAHSDSIMGILFK